MQLSTLTALALLVAPLVCADGNAEVVEFQAILSDVNNHLNDYISLAVNDPNFTVPSGVLDVYTQMTTYTDDSYTTLFSQLDFSSINDVMTALPWYSSRLEPEIQSAFQANSVTDTSIGARVTDSASSSDIVSSTTGGSDSSASSESTRSSSATDISSSARSTSATSSASSQTSASSQNVAANLNELNTILGATLMGLAAMLL